MRMIKFQSVIPKLKYNVLCTIDTVKHPLMVLLMVLVYVELKKKNNKMQYSLYSQNFQKKKTLIKINWPNDLHPFIRLDIYSDFEL